MDKNKFDFIIENSTKEQLINDAAELLIDIKNCAYSTVAHTSLIPPYVKSIHEDKSKEEINKVFIALEHLCESYKTLCSQRKAINFKISQFTKNSIPLSI